MDVDISQASGPHKDTRTLSRGRQHASGTGRTDGRAGGDARSGSFAARPRFDAPVAPNGYRWWYVDALSDDGQNGLTIIGFVGSVFSPYYARARKRSSVDPVSHCAINVALYGTKRRWAMTERGALHVMRQPDRFSVGPSSMTWDNAGLTIEIRERCSPVPFAVLGHIRLVPGVMYDAPIALDAACKHHWQAVAPLGRITANFSNPRLNWSGNAYHDMNWGEEPLEQGFHRWSWLRANTSNGTDVLYDVERRDNTRLAFGRCFRDGNVTERSIPPRHAMAGGLWGMDREVLSETPPRLIAKMEDAPFYTRNHIGVTMDGISCEAIHESLSLNRFIHPVVQMMLPFRMPRIA